MNLDQTISFGYLRRHRTISSGALVSKAETDASPGEVRRRSPPSKRSQR